MKKIIESGLYYADLKRMTPILVIHCDYESVIAIPVIKKESKGRNKNTHIKVKELNRIRPKSYLFLENEIILHINDLKGFICLLSKEEMRKINSILLNIKK